MKWLRKILGYEDKFYDLLEASAAEAQNSVETLLAMLKRQHEALQLDAFSETRRKDKRITEEITHQLCKTFVTPLEREDIEALSVALYKIPKTVEKFCEKYLISHEQVRDIDFTQQVQLLAKATATVAEMIRALRRHSHLERIKAQNDELHVLEGEADKLILSLFKALYTGKNDPLKVVIVMDLYETLEKIIDRCRDAGNVIFQIVLKYS